MRIEQLTFTRFLAAVSIVIFHYGSKSFPFNNEMVAFIFKGADVGVSYFFILSGFVMMLAYGKNLKISSVSYLWNRFVRIYPLYFIAILLTLVQLGMVKSIDVNGLILNIFMLQAWMPSGLLAFNPPSWTLSVEFVFYALFPFIFNKMFKKIELKNISIYIIIFWIISQVICQMFYVSNGTDYLGNPIMHINEFLIGNLAGYFFIKKWKNKKSNYDLQIMLFIGLLFLALRFPLNLNFHNGLLAIFFIPLIILISLNNGFITALFKKKVLVFLGEISFGIYILQHPIYSLFSAYSVNKYFHLNNPTTVFFLRLLILIVVSSIVYIYIEKPILIKLKIKNKASFLENPV